MTKINNNPNCKYYLTIDIRYDTYNKELDETSHNTDILHSNLFDTEKECIDFGNKLIKDNLWMEQYPGLKGQKLERRFGHPLVRYTLKNRTDIFISVKNLNILNFGELNTKLNQFNNIK